MQNSVDDQPTATEVETALNNGITVFGGAVGILLTIFQVVWGTIMFVVAAELLETVLTHLGHVAVTPLLFSVRTSFRKYLIDLFSR